MPSYTAPLDDISFVLNDLLEVKQLCTFKGYEDATPEMVEAILLEGAKFCENELQPLNLSGDKEGCHFEKGKVTTPKGFKEAYQAYCQAGWPALIADPAYGGQGLPHVLSAAFGEMLYAANISFSIYTFLSQGAAHALEIHAGEDLKKLYLPKLASGVWSGTMCLTEAQCGTDLGLIRTKAESQDDGSYQITGTKIFISAGEHDLTENILHLVLARLPDAPEGIRGISLFLVPKILNNGARNGIHCDSIEHKMGIKASSTCVMSMKAATGWLIGTPHKGMRAMFTMMNAARLGVALQGLGLGEVSWQNAHAYAKDRLQGRALTGTKYPDKPADPITVHPDVRKNLLTMKAFVEGTRALSYWTALNLDISLKHPDSKTRESADDLVSLLTPIVKAYLTDGGFETANLGMQIMGGHGYIHEYGMEQFARDARIAPIYEGANGIQALDLVGRKMPMHTGRLLRRFFHPVAQFIEENQEDSDLQEFLFPVLKAFGKLQQASAHLAQKSLKDPNEAGAGATDYLRLFALVALGYMWLRMVKTAQKKLSEKPDNVAFYQDKIKTARFFVQKILPESEFRFRSLMAGASSIMDVESL